MQGNQSVRAIANGSPQVERVVGWEPLTTNLTTTAKCTIPGILRVEAHHQGGGAVANRFVRAAALVVVVVIASACSDGSGRPTAPATPTAYVTPECYAAVGFLSEVMGGTWTFGAPVPAPSNQPWVSGSQDCRYQVSTDASGYKSATLDATGCYGIDPSDSEIILRSEFCSPGPSAS